MKTVNVLIRLQIRAATADHDKALNHALRLINTMLDNGCPQDDINDHDCDELGCGDMADDLRVLSSSVEADDNPSWRGPDVEPDDDYNGEDEL